MRELSEKHQNLRMTRINRQDLKDFCNEHVCSVEFVKGRMRYHSSLRSFFKASITVRRKTALHEE